MGVQKGVIVALLLLAVLSGLFAFQPSGPGEIISSKSPIVGALRSLTGAAASQLGSAVINFIGLTRLVIPSDPFTASFTIVGNSSGTMVNNTFTNETQILTFYDASSNIVLQLEGVFGNGTVDLTTLTIQMSSNSVAVNHSGVENVSRKWLYLNNTLNTGAYLCPNASVLSQISPSCQGVLNWTVAEALANTSKNGVSCALVGSQYVFSNVTGTGASEAGAVASAVSAASGGGGASFSPARRNVSSPVVERPAQLVRKESPPVPPVELAVQPDPPLSVPSGFATRAVSEPVSVGWLLLALILLAIAVGLWVSTLKIQAPKVSLPSVKLPKVSLPSVGLPRRKTALERASSQLKEVDKILREHSRRKRRKDL